MANFLSPSVGESRSKRLWFVAVSILIALFLIEGLVRLFIAPPNTTLTLSMDPSRGYELAPGHHTAEGNLFKIPVYDVFVDEHGCRDTREGTERSESEILVLGDSFAFGDGVPFEDTFLHRANAALTEKGISVQFRNCAVPGYNLTQLARQAEVQMEERVPQRVMVAFFSNDLRGATPLGMLLSDPWVFGTVGKISRTLRLITLGFRVARGQLDPPHLDEKAILFSLEKIEKAAQKTGVPPVALLIENPHHPEVDLKKVLHTRGWKVLLAPDLRESSYRIPRDGHLNRKGHQALATTLEEETSQWLPEGIRGDL